MRRIPLLLPLFLVAPLASQEISEQPTDSLRPSRSLPWSATIFDRRDLRSHPSRTLEGIMTLSPGVTRVNSNIHVRGSRAGEIEYRFGGISALDRWTNTNSVPFIPEMLEEVTVHTGAYGPELGSFGGGVVDMRLREAGDAFSVEATYLTDDFAKPGEQFLNTLSYGWTTAVVTLGTPLPFETRLFVAGEISRQANRQPMYLESIDMTLVKDAWYYPTYLPPPVPFSISRNHVPSQSAEQSVFQWNLSSKAFGPELTFFGSVSAGRKRDVTWPTAVTNYYRQRRIPWLEENATLAAVRVTENLSKWLRLSGSISYARRRTFTSDPDFGESWRSYADSAANASKGYSEFRTRYYGPNQYSAIAMFLFEHASAPSNNYRREASDVWKVNLRSEVSVVDSWKVTLAGDAEWWTLRSFAVARISGLEWLDYNQDGVADRTFSSPEQERVLTKRNLSITNFGYSFMGEETDEGIDAPRRPFIASASVNNEWHDGPFTISAGLRAQWFELDMPSIPNVLNPDGSGYSIDPIYDFNLDVLQEDKLTRTVVESYALPRIAIHYAAAGGRLFASHGSFVEVLPHQQLQLDNMTLSRLVSPYSAVGYHLGGPVPTFTVHASRSTQTEVGAEQQLARGLQSKLLLYHKTLSQQVQFGRIPWSTEYQYSSTSQLIAFINPGESSVTGVDVGLTAQPVSNVEISLLYAWSVAEGSGSSPRSNWIYVTDEYFWRTSRPPLILRPLTYQRSHRVIGTFSMKPEEGSILHGWDVRVNAVVESGSPYTRENPLGILGCATVWNMGVRSLVDPRVSDPIEPLNASRTPWISTIDLSMSYSATLGPVTITVFALVTNLLDTKNVLNVYPRTGSPNSDGWLESRFAPSYVTIPQYEQFYRWVNLQNRWAYMSATGNDTYGPPRQIRIGARVGL